MRQSNQQLKEKIAACTVSSTLTYSCSTLLRISSSLTEVSITATQMSLNGKANQYLSKNLRLKTSLGYLEMNCPLKSQNSTNLITSMITCRQINALQEQTGTNKMSLKRRNKGAYSLVSCVKSLCSMEMLPSESHKTNLKRIH